LGRSTRGRRRAAAAVAALATVALAIAGCGEEEGVAEDAVVTVYVAAPLCQGAERELAEQGGRAGSLRVDAVCLPPAGGGGRIDLAAIGANARRATEDSTTVAYIGEAEPAATRFSRPILETAQIPQLAGEPGDVAMAEVLRAIRSAGDTGSLREAVDEETAAA
jgi:branched-chain amino acid transport system substrate-binding protein